MSFEECLRTVDVQWFYGSIGKMVLPNSIQRLKCSYGSSDRPFLDINELVIPSGIKRIDGGFFTFAHAANIKYLGSRNDIKNLVTVYIDSYQRNEHIIHCKDGDIKVKCIRNIGSSKESIVFELI